MDSSDVDDAMLNLNALEVGGDAAGAGGLVFSSPLETPEPGSFGLLVFGAIGLTLRRRVRSAGALTGQGRVKSLRHAHR